MKTIAIVDIDDVFINDYENFAIDGELIATSKKDTWWRRGIRYVGEVKLKPLPKMKPYVSDDFVALENGFIVKGASYYHKTGYNACIDEILGETDVLDVDIENAPTIIEADKGEENESNINVR